ncbi:phage tail tape measure protein [Candidatus Pacearchaeota archaeon]|nr:phage tail tape measure protein [Candidatus Pacearchaeota archaeon]
MKTELGKLAKVASGKGATEKEITNIVNKVVSGQKRIQKEMDTTKKKTKNWLNEYRKLMAVARKPGVGPQTKELALKDAKRLITDQVRRESGKGAEASAAMLAKQEQRLNNINDLTRQKGLLELKARQADEKRLLTAQKMSTSIKHEASLRRKMISQIARANLDSLAIAHKLRTGEDMLLKQKQAILRAEIKSTRQLGRTNEELAKGVKLTRQAAEETRHLATVGKRPAAGTMADPSSISRQKHLGFAPATQKARAGGWIPDQDVKRMDKVRTFAADIQKYAKFQIRWFASATAIFATAGAIAAAAKAALGYYQALKNIAAITEKTDEQMKAIGDAALHVAETTPMAASAAVKMSLKLVQAGLDTVDAAEAMKTTAAVVTVAGEDMDTVAKAVTTAMFAWHKGAEDVAGIGNVLAGALNYSRLTVEDLGTAFNYLAATSSIMGRSLEETSSTLSVLSNMGIRASTIGTGLSQLMTQLVAPTAKLRQELKRIGVSANEVNPSMNSFVDILKVMEDHAFSTTKAMDILGARAGRILAAGLVAGSAEFERMEKKISRQGQLQKALAKTMEGPINALHNMRNQLEIAAIQIGSVAVPVLNLLIKVMKSLFGIIKLVTTGLAAVVEALGAITVATGLFVVAGAALIKYLIGLKVASVGAAVGMQALNLAMKAHPLLIFTGIAAAVFGIIGALKIFRKEVDKTASNHAKLEAVQDSLAKKAAQFKAQQQALERTVTSIVEAWDSYREPVIRLPFAAEARSALMWMNKLQSELSNINEDMGIYQDHIRELKKRRIGMFGDPDEMDRIDKQIKQFEKGIRRYRNTAVAAGVSVGQAFEKSMKQLGKYKPEDIGGSFVAAVLSKKDKTEVEALAMLEQDIISRAKQVEQSLLSAKKAYDATMATSSNVKERNAAIKLYEDTVRKLLPQYIAIEEAANKITVSTKQIMGRTKDYANALLRVRKQLAKMREEYKVLVTDDPFLKIHLNTKRRVQEIGLEYDKYNKKLREVNAQIAARPEAAITKELKKQWTQLTQITGVLRQQEATVKKIGNEKARILRKEIADGVHKIRIETELFNIEQKIDALKQGGGTALAIYREEVALSNQMVGIKVRELEAERQIAIAKFDGAKVVELSAKIASERGKKVGAPEQLQAELEIVGGAGLMPEDLFAQKQATLDAEKDQYAQFITDKAELDSWYMLRKIELEKEAANNTRAAAKLTHQGWKDGASAIVNTLEVLSTLQGKKSRSMFETLKVARIAQATVATYTAANEVLASPAEGPSWVRIASAAAIITAGLANVASIASTSFSGGGGGGGASAAASGEYKYYSYEQSGYAGTGWRPGDREGGYNEYMGSKQGATAEKATAVTQKIIINAMDAKSVKQLVDDNPEVFIAPVIQDIKDSGKTKEVIRDYV